MRVFATTAVLAVFCFGVANAEEFMCKIVNVDGSKITLNKGKKGSKEVTLVTADNVKVCKGKGGADAKKLEAGDAIENGLKADLFTKIDEKGLRAFMITNNASKNITEIRVAGAFEKKEEPKKEELKIQEEKNLKEDLNSKAEEAVIDRLIEILKDPQSSSDRRINACKSLGERGTKAKRAEPEMMKVFEQVAKAGTDTQITTMISAVTAVGGDSNSLKSKAEEAAIDRLIEILKDPQSSSDRRINACKSLAERGTKAKRAEPEMVKYLEQLAKAVEADAATIIGATPPVVVRKGIGSPGSPGHEKGMTPEVDAQVTTMIRAITAVGGNTLFVGKDDKGTRTFGGNSKEAVAVFSKILDLSLMRYAAETNKNAAIALAMNCTEETYAILAKAGRNKSEQIRLSAVAGLGAIKRGPNSKLVDKAFVELRVLEETDDSAAVRAAAKEALTGTVTPQPKRAS